MNTRVTLRVDFNLSSSAEDSVPGTLWARGRGAQLVGRAALTPLAQSRAGLLGGLLPSNVVYGTGQDLMVDATSAPTPELPLRVAGDGRRLSSLSAASFARSQVWRRWAQARRRPTGLTPSPRPPHSPPSSGALTIAPSPPAGTQVSFPKPADAFAFEEDSSNDGLSPEQARSEDSPGSTESPAGTKAPETAPAAPAAATQVWPAAARPPGR